MVSLSCKCVLSFVTYFLLVDKISCNSIGSDSIAIDGLIVEERDRFTLYKINLVDVPKGVCAEDIKVDLIGSQFAHVTTGVSGIEWKVKLHQTIPPEVIFYPEYAAKMVTHNFMGSVWEVTFRIPKYYHLSPILYEDKQL
ncbi:hypothetical protein BdWA1_002905 [Babesia duncani]|uniref:Uncharacterized protein n=1 Tax=Babesia duncani TaxID=323732 RepID=A0AAD9PI18_9APIC|nr:hypothetical protein BdWA1_002905 [Babesia duncani]